MSDVARFAYLKIVNTRTSCIQLAKGAGIVCLAPLISSEMALESMMAPPPTHSF